MKGIKKDSLVMAFLLIICLIFSSTPVFAESQQTGNEATVKSAMDDTAEYVCNTV